MGRGGYPVWRRRCLILGGIVAILAAGVLLQFGFLASAAAADGVGLRVAAQVFGVSCLVLGLVAVLVPYVQQGRVASGVAARWDLGRK